MALDCMTIKLKFFLFNFENAKKTKSYWLNDLHNVVFAKRLSVSRVIFNFCHIVILNFIEHHLGILRTDAYFEVVHSCCQVETSSFTYHLLGIIFMRMQFI